MITVPCRGCGAAMELPVGIPCWAKCPSCGKSRQFAWAPYPADIGEPKARAGWGGACQRGFVSDERFGPGQTVIPRTNREVTRKWRSVEQGTSRGGSV